ncbi:MAG TPA: hypothetical protein VGR00_14380, partial [Thermoanaerobaculia bacterium]|nr:hypothetical protein [Thermoanaerobaculia bacterium]
MKRTKLFSAIPLLLLSSLTRQAPAQVGPWSQSHPAWVDLNGNGLIDAGELNVYPELIYDSMLPIGDPDALYIVLTNNPFDACPGHDQTRVNATPLFDPVTLVRRHGALTDTVNAMGGPTAFNYLEETPAPVPKRPKPFANMTTATGNGTFTDNNSDGV